MTSKATTRRRAPSRTEAMEHADAPRGTFVYWWLLSTLLVLNGYDRWITELVPIVDLPMNAILAPTWAWNVPVGRLAAFGVPLEWPVWLFAMIGGGVIAVMSRTVARSMGTVPGLLALAGWALAFNSKDLVPGLLLFAGTQFGQRNAFSPRWFSAAAVGYLGLSLAATLEFGIVWLSAGLVMLPNLTRSLDAGPRWKLGFVAVISAAVLFALATCSCLGCGAALLRPLNWIWLRPSADLMPSLGSALSDSSSRLAQGALCGTLLILWMAPGASPETRGPSAWIRLFFSTLGLACGRYLWLATASMVPTRDASTVLPALRHERSLVGIAIGLALIRPLGNWSMISEEVLGTGAPSGRIDSSAWPIAGPVMLTNLDDSGEWETTRLRSQYPLVISDRWDACGENYRHYAALCRDIVEVRNDSYLRADGTWGGYTRGLKELAPALFVIDSRRLSDLRELSLSPHWQALGIDGRRTVFGNTEAQQLKDPLRKAGATLSRLEWPGLSGQPLEPNVIIVEDRQGYRRAALVLAALRLPYAALRVIRDESTATQPDVEAVCYLELAHRAQRYTGQPALIDQIRGIQRAREVEDVWWSDRDVRRLLTRSLAGLELQEDARRLDPTHANDGKPAPATKPTASSARLAEAAAELLIRQQLQLGDFVAAQKSLQQLSSPEREYFEFLMSAGDLSPSELADRIKQWIRDQDLSPQLQSEAAFSLGCLAVEVGDPLTAVTAFADSAEAAPESPFAPLRDLYWRQVAVQ